MSAGYEERPNHNDIELALRLAEEAADLQKAAATAAIKKAAEHPMETTAAETVYDKNRQENLAAQAQGIGIVPLGDRIVVRPDKTEEQTTHGIFIPQESQEKPQRGTVLAVGDGRTVVDQNGNVTTVKSKLRPRDQIIYSRYAGSIIVVDDPTTKENPQKIDYLVLSEKDVLAIVLPADADA